MVLQKQTKKWDHLNTVKDLKSRNPRESRTIIALRNDSQESLLLLLQPRKISNQARPFKYKLRSEKIISEGSLANKNDVVTKAYFINLLSVIPPSLIVLNKFT